MSHPPSLTAAQIEWRDAHTPHSAAFDDIYFDPAQGFDESHYVFIEGNRLAERFAACKSRFVIAETGFGTGLNFLCAVQRWQQDAKPDAQLWYYSFEKFPLRKDDLARCLAAWPQLNAISARLLDCYPPLITGWHFLSFPEQRVNLVLIFGDAQEQLPELDCPVDAWFLDGFDPKKNPQMWSDLVFSNMARLSRTGTSLATFTVAGLVKRGLRSAGFELNKRKGFGRKREMLQGVFKAGGAPASNRAPWFIAPPPHDGERRMLVLGAGIAGVSTALAFAERGWQVAMIDALPQPLSSGSGNPSAVLMPKPPRDQSVEGRFYQCAFLFAVRRLNELARRHSSIAWRKTGVYQLLEDDAFTDEALPDDYVQTLSAEQMQQRTSVEANKSAYYFPHAGWLQPASLLPALSELGIAFVGNTKVVDYQFRDGQWRLFESDGREIASAPLLVLAHAYGVCGDARFSDLSLEQVRGQVTYLRDDQLRTKKWDAPIFAKNYVTPAQNGVVVGATYDRNYLDTATRVDDHRRNLEGLEFTIAASDIAYAELQGRAALRLTTADHLPVVGAAYDADFFHQAYADIAYGKRPSCYPAAKHLPGLYLNIGHGARGFVSSWLSAQVLCSQIIDGVSLLPASLAHGINPARFVIRGLKRKRNGPEVL